MGLGGIDQTTTTYLAFGKYLKRIGENNKDVYQLFIDFEKAYDYKVRIPVRYPN